MTALLALAVAAHLVSLPSPLAPLSASPPIGGGARASGEGPPHRVDAATRVTVSVSSSGIPRSLRAVQRLVVRGVGDYSFSIGANVASLEVATGSQSTPGRRTGAILWAGFNPGRRILSARAELQLDAAGSLPLRVEIHGSRLTLRNTTTRKTTTFAADAEPGELLATLASFRRAVSTGTPATGGTAMILSPATPAQMSISAPLAITGTIGRSRIALKLGGATQPLSRSFAAGPVRLLVRPLPAPELLRPPSTENGRALLARAIRASLELALARQYDAFLGNPDPGGPSRTSYVYVTDNHTAPPPVVSSTVHGGRDWLRTALWAVGALVALAIGMVVWARS